MNRLLSNVWIFLLVVLLSWTVLNQSTVAAGPEEELNALLQEHKLLKQEQTQINSEARSLASIQTNLIRKTENHKAERPRLQSEQTQLKMEFDRLNQEVEQHNAYCVGTFYGDEYYRRKAWCQQNMRFLVARKQQLRQADRALLDRIQQWNAETKSINKETLDHAQRQKQVNARQQELRAKWRNWNAKLNAFRQSEAFKRLQIMARESKRAAETPGLGTSYPQLDGPNEQAVRHLQYLWDGAKRRD